MKKKLLLLFLISTSILVGQEWVARYNGPGNGWDGARAIAVDNNGNIYVTGVSEGQGTDRDYATIKYNSQGQELWVARYNGPGNRNDEAYAIAVDNNGNVYVTGYSTGSGTGEDYATIKYNSQGQELWVARYNGPGNGYDFAYAIAVDNNGNIYVTGVSEGQGAVGDYATIKYNSQGQELWVARYNGPGNFGDVARAIAVDNQGNSYVTGKSFGSSPYEDYATIKYNSEGQVVWVARYNGPGNGYDEASAIAVDNNGNVYVTGMSEGQGSSSDYATIKYPSISEVKEENKKDNTLIEGNHQNLKIFNILGQTVNSSLKDLRHGIYFIKAQEKKVKEKLSLPNKKKLYEKMLLYWRHRAKEE